MATAFHDYRCARCDTRLVDIPVSMSVGATAGAPHCPSCWDEGFSILMEWIPQIGRIDAKEPFQRFSTTDGRGNPVEIDSLRKLRRVERESEQAYRNGEGSPMVWRDYSQDGSNRDQHTLCADLANPHGIPLGSALKAAGKVRRGESVKDRPLGPGVADGGI